MSVTFLFFIVTLTYCSGTFHAGIDRRIFFGAPLKQWTFPHNSQVNLRFKFSNGSTLSVCGGVFVHKAVVLSSASCLTDEIFKNKDALQIRYGGVTYDTCNHWRTIKSWKIHHKYDAVLIRLNNYATEGISYFDQRFWSHRNYIRACGTFICGWGLTNKTTNFDVTSWDSRKINCIHYTVSARGGTCKWLEDDYKDYAECNYPVREEDWEQFHHQHEWVPSVCYGDAGTPIFRIDDDGYVKLKGISINADNCGHAASITNPWAPDVSIQIELLADWINNYLKKNFPKK